MLFILYKNLFISDLVETQLQTVTMSRMTYFFSAGPTPEPVLVTANRVEISKEEIPGSKRSMYGYILTNSRLSH